MAFPGVEHHKYAPSGTPLETVSLGDVLIAVSNNAYSTYDTVTGIVEAFTGPNAWASNGCLTAYAGDAYMVSGSSGISFAGQFYKIDATGASTIVSATGSGYWAPLVAAAGYLASNLVLIKISDGTSRTLPNGSHAVAGAGAHIYTTTAGGTALYKIDAATNTLTATYTLPRAIGATGGVPGKGTIAGNRIYWYTNNETYPAVWYDTVTGATGDITANPLTGLTLYRSDAQWVADGDTLYGIASGNAQLVAMSIAPGTLGRWLQDDPVTSRSGRWGVTPHKGKLWIPTGAPNPWPGGWP